MGRPRRTPGQRRRHQVTLSLRDRELAELKRRAGVAGLSVPDYLRQRAIEGRLRVSDPRRLGAAEFREVQRLAVNVNQMARVLHQGRQPGWGAERVLLRLHRLLSRLLPGKYD